MAKSAETGGVEDLDARLPHIPGLQTSELVRVLLSDVLEQTPEERAAAANHLRAALLDIAELYGEPNLAFSIEAADDDVVLVGAIAFAEWLGSQDRSTEPCQIYELMR